MATVKQLAEQVAATDAKLDALISALSESKGKTAAPSPKGKGKTAAPRTIKNPDARASVKQVYLICSKLYEAQFGESLPKPLTMGDVQNILEALA